MSIERLVTEGKEEKEDIEEGKDMLSSTKNLISPDKEKVLEDQKLFFDEDVKRNRGLQLRKDDKTLVMGRYAKTTKPTISSQDDLL